MKSAALSMMLLGYGAVDDHVGSAGGPAFTGGVPSPVLLPTKAPVNVPPSGSPVTRRSGEPRSRRIWNAPPRSSSFTVAGAVPVFLIVIVVLVVSPSTCDVEIDDGVTDSWPAPSPKLARVEPSAATFTVWLAAWYPPFVAVNWCDPVSEENSQ